MIINTNISNKGHIMIVRHYLPMQMLAVVGCGSGGGGGDGFAIIWHFNGVAVWEV